MDVVLIVLLILALFGGGFGYYRRDVYGPAPGSFAFVLLIVLVVILLVRHGGF